jgi:hypothetical protein
MPATSSFRYLGVSSVRSEPAEDTFSFGNRVTLASREIAARAAVSSMPRRFTEPT